MTKYQLHFYRTNQHLQTWELNPDTVFKVGRARGNDFCISDPTVSRQQFSIEFQDNQWILRDRSNRGTYVNGQRVPEAVLENGSVIMFGAETKAYFLNSECTQLFHITETMFQQ